MEKKRSKGVTIFAWLIIIGSVFTLMSVLMVLRISVNAPSVLPTIFMLTLSLFSIYVAINLFRQKEWARRAVILIAILVICYASFTAFRTIRYNAETSDMDFLKDMKLMQDKYPLPDTRFSDAQLEGMVPVARQMGVLSTIFNALFVVGFNVILFVYFTRPKVKEQFR